MEKTSVKKHRILWVIIFICVAVFIAALYVFIYPNFNYSNSESEYLYIRKDDQIEDVINQIDKKTNSNISSFKIASKLLRYNNIKSGKYEIKNGENNFSLVRKLRAGIQTPVNLRFNYIRTKEQLAGVISRQMMPDSLTIFNLLNDTAYLEQFNLNPQTSVSLFIPNTYELFWDTSAEGIFERMNKEYNKFWNDEREGKAATMKMTKAEVSTLASIVDSETNSKREKPTVAGLYINRLKKGMPLQADPTVIFAIGDFSIRRVLNKHTRYDSPYNTYRNKGLPPGPIRVPSIDGIDAVLNYKKHNYIFMCAKETLNGEHNFAETWSEHLKNARKYQKALNERGIK